MEFNEKLQELRKQKGLTQEELAEALYVSRTAVSKWESGRGYPNIESLKAIAAFFSVTIDELLSGSEVLTIAEEDHKQKAGHFRDLIFGLLDCSVALFLFLPLFGQKTETLIQSVPLLSLTQITLWLKVLYCAIITASVAWGILTLALQNSAQALWLKHKRRFSLGLNTVGMLLFILSQQPYAAVFLFLFLSIKVYILTKTK